MTEIIVTIDGEMVELTRTVRDVSCVVQEV